MNQGHLIRPFPYLVFDPRVAPLPSRLLSH